MRDEEFYICEYCYSKYRPKRRRVQRYCSNSCRSAAYHSRKTVNNNNLPQQKSPDNTNQSMSLAGIGNAATGTLLADTITKLLTSEKNKPATKGDLISIIEKLNARYHPIKNLPANHLGDYPYYDMQEGIVIYIRVNNY